MKKLTLLAFPLIVISCAPLQANTSSPVISSRSGQSVGDIQFTFTGGQGPDDEVIAQTSDGEIFRGTVVSEKIVNPYTGPEFSISTSKTKGKTTITDEISFNDNDDDFDNTEYGSTAHAMLISDRGHSMDCQFALKAPEFGLSAGGGVGKCFISDGREVPVSITTNNTVMY